MSTSDAQLDDLLAALAERNVHSRGDLERFEATTARDTAGLAADAVGAVERPLLNAIDGIASAYFHVPAGEPTAEQILAALPALYDAIEEALSVARHPLGRYRPGRPGTEDELAVERLEAALRATASLMARAPAKRSCWYGEYAVALRSALAESGGARMKEATGG